MKLPRNVKVFGAVSFLTDVHSEIVLPLLPLFVTSVLGLPATFLGLIEGIAESTSSFLKIGSGWLSDRLGRRKELILGGYSLSTLAKPLLAFVASGAQVLAIRFFDRVGKGIRTSPRDAAIADAVAEEHRGAAFGFHRAMDTGGAVVGTTIAFLLMRRTGGNFREIFLLAAIPGVAAVLILIAFLREGRPARARPAGAAAPRGPLPAPFVFFLISHGVFSMADFSYAFFLLRAQSMGIAPAVVPLLYLVYNVVYAGFPISFGRLSDRWGRIPVLLVGYGLDALMSLSFALAARAWMMWPLFAFYGLRMAVIDTVPRALASDLCEKGGRGTGIGAFHFMIGIVALPSSYIAGRLWDVLGPRAPFFFGAALPLAAGVILLAFSGRIRTGLNHSSSGNSVR
jgi:MFS family permease